MDLEQVLRLEQLLLASFPPLEFQTLGGLFVGAAGGVTGRANSAVVLGDLERPLDVSLDWAEEWFASRDLPSIFRLSPLADQELRGALAERGYQDRTPGEGLTAAMVCDLDEGGSDPSEAGAEVTISDERPDDWQAVSERPSADVDVIDEMLWSAGVQCGWAILRSGGQPVAAGRGVMAPGYLSIQAMFTAPSHRGQGLAGTVLKALHRWGRSQGAPRAFLNVLANNEPAVRLYSSLGYTDAYHYSYLAKPHERFG